MNGETVKHKANTNRRLLHTMLRVGNLEKSLDFYTGILGMKILRRADFPEGRFTLVFIGHQQEESSSVIELTYNWDVHEYEIGSAYGHIAIATGHLYDYCETLEAAGVKFLKKPGLMKFSYADKSDEELIAFIEDPDGYSIELIQEKI